jgi:hypothetical protein
VVHGVIDASGARAVGHWIDDGVIYCILNAPSLEAVCRHHQERGLACDDVHVMQDLHELRATSREDKALVRAAIDRFWPADQTATG